MKHIAVLLAPALLGLTIAGCGGGIEEGHPTSGPTDAQPAEFKNLQKQFAGKMQTQQKPAKTKTASAIESTKEKKESP